MESIVTAYSVSAIVHVSTCYRSALRSASHTVAPSVAGQTGEPSDSLEHARGPVAKHTGLIKCGFRGSDDALTLPFNIPENAFASVALRQVAVLLNTLGQDSMATTANALAATIEAGIQQYGIYTHPLTGKQQYAFEVDGFGN